MKSQLILIAFLSVLNLPLFAQSNIPIGAWKSYLPHKQGLTITQSSEKIIYGTPWSILTIDKDDDSVDFLSTVDGLTTVGIQKIAYDHSNEQLIVAYDDSAIDLIIGSEIIPIFGIRDNDNFQNKKIFDIYIDNGEFAYLATGFGIVQLNLKSYDFGFTSVANFKVNAISKVENKLLAATEDGLYYFDLSSNQIPNDFGNWELLEENNGLPVFYNAKDVDIVDDNIYLIADESVYKSNSDLQFVEIYTNQNTDFSPNFVKDIDQGWMLGLYSDVERSKLLYFDTNDNSFGEDATCADRLNDAIQDEKGRIWMAEQFDDYRYLDGPMLGCNRRSYNSPKSHEASELEIKDDILYVASGGVSDAYGYLDSRLGFYTFKDGDWTNINEGNNSFLKDNSLLNHFRVLAHPLKDILYIGSFYRGLIEYHTEADSFYLFDPSVSSLRPAVGDPDNTRISGLAFDRDNNLWIANHGAAKPLSVYTAEGIWHSFNIGSDNKIAEITIDESGLIWAVIAGNSGGVLVYNHNNTLAIPGDDQSYFFEVNNSELSTGLVSCVEVDLDGDVWVGTAEGPVVFECGGNVFDGNCRGSTRKVLQDSIPAILLQTENIKTIAIDGANRKWFGTKNGVFVQSADGETQIFHFTKDNSPLFDNSISDMKFNPNTGEMFIATEKGIISYRTASSGANERRHDKNVYAFPNPVRANYNGPIAIKGLVQNANVKITDLNGQLVFETMALGGQAIWDGKDYTGNNVTSGVYLVFSSSTDNFNDPDSNVTKILVVR